LLHLAVLRDAAISGAAAASRDDESKYVVAVVQLTVMSQTAGLPVCHGMRDMLYGKDLLALWKLECQLLRRL